MKILGNLEPEDDGMHELGPEENFNESAYYNFFDAKRQLGGFVRLGNRANEGQAEMTVCLFLPPEDGGEGAGRVLFAFARPKIANNDAFDAGGLRFDVLEPTERHRTTYRGRAIDLVDPNLLADPARAFRESPRREIELDLEHTAVGPLYGKKNDREESQRSADQQFAKAHFEQHMAVRGQLEIEGNRFEIDGFGLRDHSWGPRYWQAIQSYEWLTMNFGPDLGLAVSRIQTDGSSGKRGGVIIRGQTLQRIVDAEVEAEYASNGLYHKSVTTHLTTDDGERHTITGRVKGFIPLRNRRSGMQTHIGEGMTEWHFDGRVGYGLSEFLRQVR